MEHINIIVKEDIMAIPDWLIFIGGAVSICIICSSFIYWSVVKNPDKVMKYSIIAGITGLVFCICFLCITSLFCKEPTGKCEYQAIVDKDNITVSQYSEFIEKHNPDFVDGIYYWVE